MVVFILALRIYGILIFRLFGVFALFLDLTVDEKGFITSELSVVYFNGYCVRSHSCPEWLLWDTW